jgi:hypothetical protein
MRRFLGQLQARSAVFGQEDWSSMPLAAMRTAVWNGDTMWDTVDRMALGSAKRAGLRLGGCLSLRRWL